MVSAFFSFVLSKAATAETSGLSPMMNFEICKEQCAQLINIGRKREALKVTYLLKRKKKTLTEDRLDDEQK